MLPVPTFCRYSSGPLALRQIVSARYQTSLSTMKDESTNSDVFAATSARTSLSEDAHRTLHDNKSLEERREERSKTAGGDAHHTEPPQAVVDADGVLWVDWDGPDDPENPKKY